MKNVISIAVVALFFPLQTWAVYDLPAARKITWQTGSDIWNGGVLPNYPSVTCSPLYGNGTTDDTSRINACIAAAAANTAVFIPAGTYLVNGQINLKNNVVLRGAGASSTILKGTPHITTPGGSVSPALKYNNNVVGYLLSGSPQKGDTTVTLQTSSQASVGDWISIGSDNDPSYVSATGSLGLCAWCGENSPYHVLQQIVQVTAKNGSVITLSKPLYSTLFTTPQFKRYTFGVKYAGVENLKLDGTGNLGATPFINLSNALFCWVKGVETNNTGSSSGSSHVRLQYSYGCEVRDSYFHDQRSGASGAGYGIHVYFINSDHKIENNILRHNRHSFTLEGGGTGCAFLYNYVDDNYTDDLTYLGSARFNHGAHPYMNLFEGNIISHITADDYWGTSSHFVAFRNWLWGDETWSGVPGSLPSSGYVAIDVWNLNTSYSFIGNVLGITGKHANWADASIRPSGDGAYASASSPVVYGYDPTPSSTSINHGNWDYKTQGVAYWEGGSDHVLKNSMYYESQPAYWCSETPWPSIGPDVSSNVNDVPAKRRYDGIGCTSTGVPPPPKVPNVPIGIKVQ